MKNEPRYSIRPIEDLKDMIVQSDNLFGDKDAFVLKTNDTYRGIKYKQFKSDIDAFGTALLDLGLKDKTIAVIGENRYEWCVTYLSVVNGTGIVVPLDREIKTAEITNLLITSEASAVVFSGKLGNEFNEIVQSLPTIKYFISMDLEEDQDGFLSFRQLVNKGNQLINMGSRLFLDAPIDPDAMNIVLFTSGTTEHAKGVMLSHRNICFDVLAVLSEVYVDSNDFSLSILPLHHTYECSLGFIAMIYSGGTICFNEGLKHIAKNFKETKPTVLFTVPLLLESMHKRIWEQASKKRSTRIKLIIAIIISNFLYSLFRIDIRKRLFKQIHENIGGKLRLVFTGAAAIDPMVSKGFRSFGIRVLQGYGLTECSPLVTANTDTSFKDNSIGLPLPGVEMKIDNPDESGIGEIVVKGPNVMLGYFKDECATKKVLQNGWFYTGDLGYKDRKGFYYITGRKKNVIVTKNGKNIFPEEVEAYLNKSLYIQESLVWGSFDEDTGETKINAQIVPDFNFIKENLKINNISNLEITKLLKEEIKNINNNMPLYKRIRDFSIRENEFIKTTTRKIKRYAEKIR